MTLPRYEPAPPEAIEAGLRRVRYEPRPPDPGPEEDREETLYTSAQSITIVIVTYTVLIIGSVLVFAFIGNIMSSEQSDEQPPQKFEMLDEPPKDV